MRKYLSLLIVVLALGCGDDEPESGEFGASCSADTDCNSPMTCYAFMDGSKCTVPCPASGSCPEGSSGCNNMGVCKTK